MSGLETFETLENFESFDTFDGSQPNLVSNKLIADIEARLKLNSPSNNNTNKVINGLGTFYNDYILPNLFPIIVITLLVLYLTIKYILKRDREEKAKLAKLNNSHSNNTNAITNTTSNTTSYTTSSSIDAELIETLAKAKQHMLKVNIDSQDDSHIDHQDIQNYINSDKEYNDLKKRHLESSTNKKSVSDMISDDYLLTETETENNIDNNHNLNNLDNQDNQDNLDNPNRIDGMDAINNNDNDYNKDERTRMLDLEDSFRWGIDRGSDKKMDDVARLMFGNQG